MRLIGTQLRSAAPPTPPTRRRVPVRRRLVAALALAVTLMAGCTITENAQYQVDVVPFGYHMHLYKTTTMLVWFAHSTQCNWNASCTLKKVWEQASFNGIIGALSGADFFFDDDVDDFANALNATQHPWPLNVNDVQDYGCLGGYKNLVIPHSDGDWYADNPWEPWCKTGSLPS